MKFDKKVFNISAWIVVISTYILPSHNYGEFATNFGYPVSYLTIYNNSLNKTLLSSFHLNIVALFINICIIYSIIFVIKKVLTRIKKNKNIDVVTE